MNPENKKGEQMSTKEMVDMLSRKAYGRSFDELTEDEVTEMIDRLNRATSDNAEEGTG